MLGTLHKIDHLPNAVLTPFTTWTSLTLCQHLARFDLQNEEGEKLRGKKAWKKKQNSNAACNKWKSWSQPCQNLQQLLDLILCGYGCFLWSIPNLFLSSCLLEGFEDCLRSVILTRSTAKLPQHFETLCLASCYCVSLLCGNSLSVL